MSLEPLDIEQPSALEAYLRATRRIHPREPLKIAVLMGGVSNRTVLVERPSGEAWVLKQALPKLRVAVDWFSDPRRIEREALGIRHLGELVPSQITPLVFEDPANHLLAMEAVPRTYENWKTLLMSGRDNMTQVWSFALLLASIHAGGWKRRDDFARIFDDRGFFRSLRLEPYYQYTASQVPDAAEFLEELVQTTLSRRLTLVHGDYSPKNVLAEGWKIILLDHEVIHYGDPAFDVGFAMTHLLSKYNHFADRRDRFLIYAQEFWKAYSERLRETEAGPPPWSADLGTHAVRHTLGCLLARVAGRSPLEYLNPAQRRCQQEIVLGLIRRPPRTVPELIEAFTRGIASHP
jgi:aminoglycoside phosphotransferase (APT) family kinase protein